MLKVSGHVLADSLCDKGLLFCLVYLVSFIFFYVSFSEVLFFSFFLKYSFVYVRFFLKGSVFCLSQIFFCLCLCVWVCLFLEYYFFYHMFVYVFFFSLSPYFGLIFIHQRKWLGVFLLGSCPIFGLNFMLMW